MTNSEMMVLNQGRIQDFKLGGGHLKKLRRAEGDAKLFGVFRVKSFCWYTYLHVPIIHKQFYVFDFFCL